MGRITEPVKYSTRITRTLPRFIISFIVVGVFATVLTTDAQTWQQTRTRRPIQFRRPSPSPQPSRDIFRNNWLEYIRSRTTSTISPFRRPTNSATTGIQCVRGHAMFVSKTDPAMYHLCARTRDSWYVYHFRCPNGQRFDEKKTKCTQSRTTTVSPYLLTSMGTTSTPKSNKVRDTNRFKGIAKKTTRTPVISTTKLTLPTTVTTESPIQVPDSAVTDPTSSSEEYIDVDIHTNTKEASLPGLLVTSSSHQPSNDDDEAVTEGESSEEYNLIPESGVVNSETSPAPLPSVQTEATVTMKSATLFVNDAKRNGRPKHTKPNRHYLV